MEEYLQYMKTLRTQMNDVEDQAAKISVDEQKQITTIHTLENDLKSAKSEIKRLMEQTDEMVKTKAEICSRILDKQKRIASLESDSFNLSQTMELMQQERTNLSAKLLERRAYYANVVEGMTTKLQEQKDWLDEKQRVEPLEGHFMEADITEELSTESPIRSRSGDECKILLEKLHAAQTKLDELTFARNRLVAENTKLKQSVEQLKTEINELKSELSTTEIKTLEEELNALSLEKDGELEYTQSLQSQVNKLKGISKAIKCACGGEYRVEMALCDVGG